MNSIQIGRIVSKVLVRLKSYKSLQESIVMEYSMCNHCGVPFSLPVDRLMDECVAQAARLVAPWFGVDVETAVEYFDIYSHCDIPIGDL